MYNAELFWKLHLPIVSFEILKVVCIQTAISFLKINMLVTKSK